MPKVFTIKIADRTAQDIRDICAGVLATDDPKTPAKFYLAQEALASGAPMGGGVAISWYTMTQAHVQAVCDTVGGFYCSIRLLVEKYKHDKFALERAEVLVATAIDIQDQAIKQGYPRLEIVPGGRS